MAAVIEYDDSKLRQMFAELEPKRRAQGMRNAFSRAARVVRKRAVSEMRQSLKGAKDTQKTLDRGIRSVNYRRVVGFKVTVGTKKHHDFSKSRGFHINRRGLSKPVLIWAEDGTDRRKTRGGSWRRRKKSRSTGAMPRFGFMEKTKTAELPQVDATLKREMVESITKISKKYGCKT